MKREILCHPCAKERQDRGPHPEDIAMGFQSRYRVLNRAKAPLDHGIIVGCEFCGMVELHCDSCNAIIADGESAVAVTSWNTNRELEPRPWEAEYEMD